MKLAILLSSLPLALGAALLDTRVGCSADNILRDLRNPTRSVAASVFCSSYIQSTSTVYASSTYTSTLGATIALPDVTTLTTSTDFEVASATETDIFYSAEPTVTVVVPTITTTVEPTVYLKGKRSLVYGEPSQFATVPASRISSACSCFLGKPAPTRTVTLTSTFAVETTSTATAPPSATDTIVILTTLSITSTLTTISNTLAATTTTTTSTISISTAIISPTCSASGTQLVQNYNFAQSDMGDPTDWTITTIGEDFQAFVYSGFPYNGNENALIITYPTGQGVISISQQLNDVIPGKTYAFSAAIGVDGFFLPSVIELLVTLDSQILFDDISVCDDLPYDPTTSVASCERHSLGYTVIKGLVQPEVTNPTLSFTYQFPKYTNYETLLAHVTFTECI